MKAIDGSAPIHYAAAKGSVEILKLLVNCTSKKFRAADHITMRDNEHQTPLHRAAQKGRQNVSRLNKILVDQ